MAEQFRFSRLGLPPRQLLVGWSRVALARMTQFCSLPSPVLQQDTPNCFSGAEQSCKRTSRSVQGCLSRGLRTGTVSLPARFVGHSESQGQPGCKGWRNILPLLMEGVAKSHCKGYGYREEENGGCICNKSVTTEASGERNVSKTSVHVGTFFSPNS